MNIGIAQSWKNRSGDRVAIENSQIRLKLAQFTTLC